MQKFLTPVIVAINVAVFIIPAPVKAGGGDDKNVVVRREFHESSGYPYVFVPVSYLETGGPNKMRFAQVQAECSHRDAPPLPAATPTPTPTVKSTESPTEPEMKDSHTASAAAATEPRPTPIPPAFPPPTDAPAAGGPDLTKVPDEVMSYFKNPYNSGPRGPHLFDPIFEPTYHQGPPSKATYELSDKPR